MDERKKRILRAIVQDYVQSAEPVGSRTLAKKYQLGISPATVRNEMSDLEEEGFLEQPHTSAGRIPSVKGYRFYVDSLQPGVSITKQDAQSIGDLWTPTTDMGDFFLEVAKMISQISHNVSLFLAPAHDTSVIRFIHVLPISDSQAVMVVVTDVGALDNEPMHFEEPSRDVILACAARFSQALTDISIGDITIAFLTEQIQALEGNPQVYEVLALTLYRAIAKRKLFYSVGATQLLEQPEFQDIKKVQPILSMLEQSDQLSQLMHPIKSDAGQIQISIGAENANEELKDLSLIQASFGKDKQAVGTLAVLGPTRMEYGRIIGILTYIQQFITGLSKQQTKR